MEAINAFKPFRKHPRREIDTVVVYHQAPDLFWMGYAVLTSFAVFIIGMVIFHNTEPYFAENI